MGIELSLREYETNFHDWVEDLYEYANTKREKALAKTPDLKSLASRLEETGWDILKPLIEALKKEDLDSIIEHRSLMFEAMRIALKDWKYTDTVDRSSILRKLEDEVESAVTYLQVQEESEPADLRAEYDNLFQETMESVKKQGEAVLGQIRDAAGRSPHFQTKTVVVEPHFNKDVDDPTHPPGVYQVTLGKGSYSPGFSLFVESNGNIKEVEDVLQGGDTDFFSDNEAQQDYFNLIHEIQHPGSAQRGKWIKVYTARPIKDRHQYEGAHSIPANIFMATTLEEAEGLAHELPGYGARDVWSMWINTKDVILTLDQGRLKHYQAVRSTPVRNIELIIPGDSVGRVAREWVTRFLA